MDQSVNCTTIASESARTREEWPLPVVSSTRRAAPVANRRVSPSLAVTSHSPLITKKKLRAAEGCQSLDQPAGALIKLSSFADVAREKSNGGADGIELTGARSTFTSSKWDSPFVSV